MEIRTFESSTESDTFNIRYDVDTEVLGVEEVFPEDRIL